MKKMWKRIAKGEMLPTNSIIRPIDGGLPNIAGSCVTVGQDCYYLSVDDACELLKDLPLETETETKKRNEATIIKKLIGLVKETELIGEENRTSLLDWLEKQGEQKEYTFKSLPRLLDMIEPTSKAKAYCQKLIDALVKEGYTTDAKIVGECLKAMNGENVPMAIMDEEPVSEDLNTAAKEYANNITKKIGYRLQLRRAVCFGANWQKEKMMKEAIEGIARPDDSEIWCNLSSFNLKDGDKVRVVVIKED